MRLIAHEAGQLGVVAAVLLPPEPPFDVPRPGPGPADEHLDAATDFLAETIG